jgi:hypothetical protein
VTYILSLMVDAPLPWLRVRHPRRAPVPKSLDLTGEHFKGV